jgi:hypothetical protein
MTSELPIPDAEPDDDAWDFEQWVIDNRVEHAEALYCRLTHGTPDPEREAQRKARLYHWLVKVPSGRIGNTWMCWVCYADRCFTSPRHPNFRACRDCLVYDRSKAANVGLKMLLPLMDWHTQPTYRPGEGPRNLWVRSILADAWTKVSALNEWRVDGCILVGTIVGDDEIDLLTWRSIVEPSPARSKRCWDSFVQHYHPDLATLLAEV